MTIKVKKYNNKYNTVWDEFVENSKNGTFMLKRNYMDYHSDRFQDNSLMFFDDNKLIALLPASLHNNELHSHGGLTYGGFIVNTKLTTQKMLDIFNEMSDFSVKNHIARFIYKRIPSIYHLYPADEDLYALFKYGAQLIRRDISAAILIEDKIKFSELRKRCVKKAIKNNLFVKQSLDYKTYIDILSKVLKEHHNAKPVHTAEELILLSSRFPNEIKLFGAFDNANNMYAGVLIFDTKQTVHAQYIATSEQGRELGALDLVFDYLINEYSQGKKYFDFGISTENNGMYLNNGLISQKEGFGGRGVVYDFYELNMEII